MMMIMMMMMMMIIIIIIIIRQRRRFTVDGGVRGEESFSGNWVVGDEVDDDAAAVADNVWRDATAAAVASNHLWAIDRLSVVDRHPVKHAPRMTFQVKLPEAVYRIAARISSGKVEKVLRSVALSVYERIGQLRQVEADLWLWNFQPPHSVYGLIRTWSDRYVRIVFFGPVGELL